MLLGNFFNISEKTITGNHVLVTIDINARHHIFEGHFPGQPVVPGVCMMQIVKELVENVIDKKTQLSKADHLKFLAVINPLENPTIQSEFTYDMKEDNTIAVTGKLYKEAMTFLKFKGSFVSQAEVISQ
ncbi:MAG: 3-hydroxyacyl-ACP dehydratase [Ferruginibacter sp.]